MSPLSTGQDRLKRAFDLTVAVSLLVLTLPVQAVAAVAIRLRLGSPVLFRQARAGLGSESFELVKFRTMLNVDPVLDVVDDGDARRMTPLGRRLRATSIDELPTLWNVVRGEMSLVGPRPLFTSYLQRYSPEQARRHEVRPGLTGLAQVAGRNSLSWEDRFRLDVQYVDHHTLLGDLRILLDTVRVVAGRDDVAPAGSATMPEFLGTAKPPAGP